MTSARGTILVAGATGRQGGAVTRHLRANGFGVRALTRDPGAAKAEPLRRMGVDLVRGDLTDRAGVDTALRGVDGVFAVGTPFEGGIDAEIAMGRTLGEAAAAAGVRHYVYSSVGGADRHSGVPHFESKRRVEEHLHDLELPLTIVRPVYFFENFVGWAMQPSGAGYALGMPLPPSTRLQGVAADDIGAFVALNFLDPDRWIGAEYELAGDELTLTNYARALSVALGLPVAYLQVPWDDLRRRSEDLARMYEFLARGGYDADIGSLRAMYPGMRTFTRWLSEGGAERLCRAA